MTRPLARPVLNVRPKLAPLRARLLVPALALMLAAAGAGPLAAQQTFSLPPPTPTPTPAPAGPADERAGVAIPPRALPTAAPSPAPQVQPLPSPSASVPPRAPSPAPTLSPAPAPTLSPAPQRTPAPAITPQADASGAVPDPLPAPITPPAALPDDASLPQEPSAAPSGAVASEPDSAGDALPDWWPLAAGGLGLAAMLGAGAWAWRRRRRPKAPRLAAPTLAAAPALGENNAPPAPPRLDLTLEIIAATRSVMMFTVEYRLTIANRSDRAVNDLHAAVQIVCARASAAAAGGGSGPSAGAAQALGAVARIGPHQARSITGTAQLPLSAIAPLRQGQTPLFIPLAHVTLEGEGLPADTKTFVIGTPSPSGRVHPIALDQPPGSIAGLKAQAVAVPAASAAA